MKSLFRLILVAVFLSTTLLVAVFLSTTLPVVSATENEKHLLRYCFQKGDTLEWNVRQTLRVTTSLKGKTETIETSSRSTKIWTVLDVSDDDVATFEYKVGAVKMQQSQTDKKDEKYDSNVDKEIPEAFITLEETVGVPLAELSIDALGEMKRKQALRKYAGASEENRIAIPLPKDPIAVGERWDIETPIEIQLHEGTVKKIAAGQRFTLDSVRNDVATISFRTIIRTPINDPKIESQIIDKDPSGSLKLDLKTGRLISQQTEVNKHVIDFQGRGSWIHHHARLTECCCGLKSCEICQ